MKIVFLSLNINRWKFGFPAALLQSYLRKAPIYSKLEITDLVYRIDNVSLDRVDTTLNGILSDIVDEEPDILAISTYVWNVGWLYGLLPLLKEKLPDVKVVAGGPEYQWSNAAIMDEYHFLDYVVIGDGEVPLHKLLEFLLSDDESLLREVPNIMYRNRDNEVIAQKGKQFSFDINNIPSPYLNGMIKPDMIPNKGAAAPILTQRGCPLSCGFCYENKLSDKVRYMKLETVFAEIDLILQNKGDKIFFLDSTFNSQKKRAKTILKYIYKKTKNMKPKPSVIAEMVPEFFDDEMLMLCKLANIQKIEVGIQSLNPKAVDIMQRYRDETKLFHNLDIATKIDLNISPQIIYGLPGDNVQSFLHTFDRVYMLPTRGIEIFRLNILPGTLYWDMTKQYGIKFDNEIKPKKIPYSMIKSNDFSSEDLAMLRRLGFVVSHTNEFKKHITDFLQSIQLKPSEFYLKFLDYRVLNQQLHHGKFQKGNNIGAFQDLYSFLTNEMGMREESDLTKAISSRISYLNSK